ncbi:hypothetical protein WJX82_007301 [Trebouxia sp. C0006]
MQSTPLLGVPTPEISKAGNELLCCCTTRQVRSCDRFCIKDLVRVYVIWQGLLYVLLFAFGGYLLSDQSPSKFVYCPEITAKVSCFHTRTASTPTDCYDAVTVVMGIVLVVMAMVMMGGCDQIAWAACALTQVVPCVAFGLNMNKALRLPVVWQTTLFAFLFVVTGYLYYGAAVNVTVYCAPITVQNSTADMPPLQLGPDTEECHAAQALQGISFVPLVLVGLIGTVYATYRRTQIRKKFGIAGSELGDFCQWCWCPACALCQETRTLWHNNVTEGVWLGPTTTGLKDTALAHYSAPGVNQMHVLLKEMYYSSAEFKWPKWAPLTAGEITRGQ